MDVLILNFIPIDILIAIAIFASLGAYLSRPKRKKKLLKNDSSHHACQRQRGVSSRWRSKELIQLFGVCDADSIKDSFLTLEAVSEGLKTAGLVSSNLILGIDFTMSNRYQGISTFNAQSLHDTSSGFNPYQQVIRILGKTLEPFDEDGLIPTFGFGDAVSKDVSAFNFSSRGQPYLGFEQVLLAYNHLVSRVDLSGPTNFAPVIYRALEIVKATHNYHILVIVSDGQVTREYPTMRALVDASFWPLSIVLIGVGDGPWDIMLDFDDALRGRLFDNFQFVDFHKVTSTSRNPQAALALAALMEIPEQYAMILKLGLLDRGREHEPCRVSGCSVYHLS